MRTLRGWNLLWIAFVIVGCSRGARSTTPTPVVPTSDVGRIRAVFDTTAAGWNRGDLRAYLSAYTDAATTMGRTGPVRGRSAIGDQIRAAYWKTGRPLQVLSYDRLEVKPLGPDYALVTGRYILSGASVPDRSGWFTTIWERTPAGWRMIHDHSS